MSEEEKELLARIGQLAGQINRHKNHQSGPRQVPNQPRYTNYRNRSAPYPSARGGGYRAGRQHQHRTLHLNATGSPANNGSVSSGSETPSGWVSKTDRHRQLINASVYEKDSQNRAKAIEQTRQRKLMSQRQREKTQFSDFMKHQAAPSGVATNAAGQNNQNNTITIQGIQFRVVDGGKKLVKVSDAFHASSETPKLAEVAGVKFHRTKTGNLVAHRFVTDQRRSGVVKKIDEPCRIFSSTGSCPKGPRCRYNHDPNKVAICKEFLRDGECANGESCDLSHDLTPERTPNCLHFAKGHCAKADCPYTHSKASPAAPVCRAFGFNGYCDRGGDCTERHVFECPDFSNTGKCNNKGCKLLHRERASVLRNQAMASERMDDVSSDEEAADSDDVDSDEVAEFIDADSDCSDFDEPREFISI